MEHSVSKTVTSVYIHQGKDISQFNEINQLKNKTKRRFCFPQTMVFLSPDDLEWSSANFYIVQVIICRYWKMYMTFFSASSLANLSWEIYTPFFSLAARTSASTFTLTKIWLQDLLYIQNIKITVNVPSFILSISKYKSFNKTAFETFWFAY